MFLVMVENLKEPVLFWIRIVLYVCIKFRANNFNKKPSTELEGFFKKNKIFSC